MSNFNIDEFVLNKNYCIEASAGTGKTHNIVEIVRKISESGIPLSKILIVTYTNKACGELKDRIRTKLNSKDSPDIYTFHSFCEHVIKEFALSGDFDLGLDVVDASYLDDFLDNYIRSEEFFNLYYRFLNFDASKGVTVDAIKKVISQALSAYYLDYNYNEDENIIKFDESGKDTELLMMYTDILNGVDFATFRKHHPEFDENLSMLESSSEEKLNKMANNIFANFNNGKIGYEKSVCSASAKMKQNDAFMYFYNLNSIDFKPINFILYKELGNIYKAYQEDKRKNKVQDINDLLRNVFNSLTFEFINKIREKYRYALIDEFQDTNYIEYNIFKKIFVHDGNNIIVVGDPKQSIYSFQGADVNVYNAAASELSKDDEIARLSKNWRSTKDIVNACNYLFKGFDFDIYNKVKFEDSLSRTSKDGEFRVSYKGLPVAAVWVASLDKDTKLSLNNFNGIIAESIIDCCKTNNGKTNLMISSEEDINTLRNVTYNDFTILARTSKDIDKISRSLKKVGIPVSTYKDTSLFKGLEIEHWIRLLECIDAPDLSGNNRRLFKAALVTLFFGKDIVSVSRKIYEKDSSVEFSLITKWKDLANASNVIYLFDSILNDSYLRENLSSTDKLDSFSKFEQISDFCIDYISNNHSLTELIDKLDYLAHGNLGEEDENSIGINGKTTDFNSVKIMTMHASKGLEAPIVFFYAEEKPKITPKYTDVYTYHDDNALKHLSFDQKHKERYEQELILEEERLYYVAYTRAKYILVLPNMSNPKYDFYSDSLDKFLNGGIGLYKEIYSSNKSLYELKGENNAILFDYIKEEDLDIDKRNKELQSFIHKTLKSKGLYQHSYASLTKDTSNIIFDEDEKLVDKEGTSDVDTSMFDNNAIQIDTSLYSSEYLVSPSNFPKGTFIGTALHSVFEKIDYTNLLDLDKRIESEMSLLNENCPEWNNYVRKVVKNTTEAILPLIKGNKQFDKTIKLSSISYEDRLNEASMDYMIKGNLNNFINGSPDLIFKHDGVYSIVDWKSNTFPSQSDYQSASFLKEEVDTNYAIQRVLYSYSLVKWLSEMMSDVPIEEVFENYFGGIYYVFIKGCVKDSSNGIYAQTWESFKDLEDSYNEIIKVLIGDNND